MARVIIEIDREKLAKAVPDTKVSAFRYLAFRVMEFIVRGEFDNVNATMFDEYGIKTMEIEE